MSRLWLLVVCVCVLALSAVPVMAEGDAKEGGEADPPAEKPVVDRKELQKQARDVFMELRKIQPKIMTLSKKFAEEETVKAARTAMDDARKAYMDAQKAYTEALEKKVGEDPEGKELVAKKAELEAKRKEIQDKLRAASAKKPVPAKKPAARKPKKDEADKGDNAGDPE